jgi:branched-chain amino acid aminotransferase
MSNVLPVCWFDGEFKPLEQVPLHPLTSSFMYATGCFEGIRSYPTKRGPAVFRLREHMDRFQRSAATYGMKLKHDAATHTQATLDLIKQNKSDVVYIRPVAYFGLAPTKPLTLAPRLNDVQAHVCIAMLKLDNYLSTDQTGIRATLSPHEKFSSKAMPAKSKSFTNYANSTLAFTDAVARGYHEAILLNVKGEVSEATAENIFIVKNGRLYTNDESADILMGITRDSVLTLAKEIGVPVEIRPLTLADLKGADEVFMTGTAAEVQAIACLDDLQYPTERPVTNSLAKAYRACVLGEDEKHLDWLAFVN